MEDVDGDLVAGICVVSGLLALWSGWLAFRVAVLGEPSPFGQKSDLNMLIVIGLLVDLLVLLVVIGRIARISKASIVEWREVRFDG